MILLRSTSVMVISSSNFEDNFPLLAAVVSGWFVVSLHLTEVVLHTFMVLGGFGKDF